MDLDVNKPGQAGSKAGLSQYSKAMANGLRLLFRRGGVVSILRSKPSKFVSLYYSTMSRLLIEEPKYSWLQELGLKANNPGVFCGAWSGDGQVNKLFSTLAPCCSVDQQLSETLRSMQTFVQARVSHYTKLRIR